MDQNNCDCFLYQRLDCFIYLFKVSIKYLFYCTLLIVKAESAEQSSGFGALERAGCPQSDHKITQNHVMQQNFKLKTLAGRVVKPSHKWQMNTFLLIWFSQGITSIFCEMEDILHKGSSPGFMKRVCTLNFVACRLAFIVLWKRLYCIASAY